MLSIASLACWTATMSADGVAAGSKLSSLRPPLPASLNAFAAPVSLLLMTSWLTVPLLMIWALTPASAELIASRRSCRVPPSARLTVFGAPAPRVIVSEPPPLRSGAVVALVAVRCARAS